MALRDTGDALQRSTKPLIVGIGGTTRDGSATELSLLRALQAAENHGARTHAFGGTFLYDLPIYSPHNQERTAEQRQLVEAVRSADGLVVASPGYHGGISGLVKNALDLLEDLNDDRRPYLEGRAVGCIVTAAGWQACGTTLVSLRSVIHALRGWPTPFGATLNAANPIFDDSGACIDERAAGALAIVGRQVFDFASRYNR
jgi:FMN reductase